MEIIEITTYSPEVWQAVNCFLNQLVTHDSAMTESLFKTLIHSGNSHLFCAVGGAGQYIGMLTVGLYVSPTGTKGWIEDVVVDKAERGKGVGEELTKYAISFAKDKGVALLMLTSNPSRVAANALYQKIGFVRKETNMYTLEL